MRIAGALIAAIALAGTADARAATFTVNQTTDVEDPSLGDDACDVNTAMAGNQCSMRAALQQANFTAGLDNIHFSIPGDQIHRLSPITALPVITGAVNIDGFTQPGASPNTKKFGKPLNAQVRIELDGDSVNVDGSNGLAFGAGSNGSSVSGLAIGNWTDCAIVTADSVGVGVYGSLLGMDATGVGPFPNACGFISGNQGSALGGLDVGQINVIAGNASTGVETSGSIGLYFNYIGTTSDPSSPAPNGETLGGTNVYLRGEGSVVRGNIIANASVVGVRVQQGAEAQIFENRIFGHDSGQGIDVGPTGVTPNDPGDADEYTNFPVIESAKRKRTTTKVSGTLDGRDGDTYTVHLYTADGNTRQGERYLGFTNVIGGDKFKAQVTKLGKGERIVATAEGRPEDVFSLTSEFSKPKKVK